MKILKILFIMFVSTPLWAISQPPLPTLPVSPRIPSEAWVKLTCFGIVTPRYEPTIEKKIMTAHLKVPARRAFPRFEDLRDTNSDFIKNLTKLCTERRWSQVVLGDFSGVWLDWGSDWGYTRFEIGEEFVYNVNQCRAVGKPCEMASQCCGNMRSATCNVSTKTCESTLLEMKKEAATLKFK